MRTDSHLTEVIALAKTQNYVITRVQALDCKMSRGWWHGGAGGRLMPLLRGTAMVICPGGPAKPGAAQHAQAAVLLGEATTAVCLGTALRLAGIQGTPLGDPEHILAEHSTGHQRKDLLRHTFPVKPADIELAAGVRTTSLARSLLDAFGAYDRAHAVAVLDSARHLKKLAKPALDQLRVELPAELRSWVDLSYPKCESPLETRCRLLLIDNRLPWQSQVWMTVPGWGRTRVDFLVGKRTIVECDGREAHDGARAWYADRKREDALRKLGFEVVRVTWADVNFAPAETLRRILDALGRVG